PSNPADLQVSYWDPAIGSIQTRVHPCARLQLQHAFILVQHPDSGEGRVEVMNDSFRASAQNLPQLGWLGKGSAHVSPNTRLACLRVLHPFSVLDVEPGAIPSIDSSPLIEQRIEAEQEPAISAVLTQHTLLIFERYGAGDRLPALLAQPLRILRVYNTSAIVPFPHLFQSEAVVIHHRLIDILHGSIGAQHVDEGGDDVSNLTQV